MKKVKENGMIKFSNVIEKQPSNLIAKICNRLLHIGHWNTLQL